MWQPTRQAASKESSKTRTKKSNRLLKIDEEDEEEEEEESEEEGRSRKKKKEKDKNWEKETAKQRAKRHKKYEKMSDTSETDKQSVKHQVGAMYKSVIAQEKVVAHLRTLQYEDSDEEQEGKDLLEEVLVARKELVERINYLEVAFDYDWDAAKVYREMKESNPSSMVLKAVTEAKKRKAAGKKESAEDKKKKKDDSGSSNSNNNNSGGNRWRGGQAMYPPQYWPPPPPPPQYHSYQAPTYAQPPAAPYGRQAAQFRPSRPPGCFNCGEANHGFRRCPNMPGNPPPPPKNPPPPNT